MHAVQITRLTSHDATPIAVYRALHTGPNTQFGGFQLGFFKVCTSPSLGWALGSDSIEPSLAFSDMENCGSIRKVAEKTHLVPPLHLVLDAQADANASSQRNSHSNHLQKKHVGSCAQRFP